MPGVVEVHTLQDGAQPAEATAERLVDWLGAASRSLDLALYDVRLPGPVGDAVADALRGAMRRGVRVRLAFNDDTPGPDPRPFEPPPPSTERHVLEELGAELKGIPGWRDLMHHKYVVRDEAAVWTGSMNWTLDSWTRQENVIATVDSREVARAYARNFGQLWETGKVGVSGNFDSSAAGGVRPWFTPGRGRALSHRIAERISAARRRVRIATPLVTAGPILAALNEVIAEERVDIEGVCDATQVRQVFRQWAQNPRSKWKGAAARRRAGGVQRQALDPVRGRLDPRLHARQGHRRRRRRLPRLVQPLALGRDERRERARDRRPGAGGAARRLDRRASCTLSRWDLTAAWALTLLGAGCLPFAVGAAAGEDGGLLPPCPFRSVTGLPCPLCGATRAFALAVRGDGGLDFVQRAVGRARRRRRCWPASRCWRVGGRGPGRARRGIAAALFVAVAWAYALAQRGDDRGLGRAAIRPMMISSRIRSP